MLMVPEALIVIVWGKDSGTPVSYHEVVPDNEKDTV
jgi:hypothetical protein